MKKQVFNFSLCLLFSASLSAQKIEYVCGEYTYPASRHTTPEEAMHIALERAKINAIGKMFGITVSEDAYLDIKEENGKLSKSFQSFGGTEVKGEWLRDSIGTEKYHPPYYDMNVWFYKASVCGWAREVIGAGVDFSAKVLKNGTEAKFESNEFMHKDDIYLLFRSPVDGYLAVYLVDDSETAFCLLPYPKTPQGKTNIKAGKEYIFFSEKHADRTEKQIVTEYMLTCEKTMERNRLYIIFSPNEFTKANDSENKTESQYTLPRELSFADFQKWMAKNKQRDKDMKVDIKSLIVKK